jgi:hypothetical protein
MRRNGWISGLASRIRADRLTKLQAKVTSGEQGTRYHHDMCEFKSHEHKSNANHCELGQHTMNSDLGAVLRIPCGLTTP